jgi:hypothetical protein
MSFLIGGLLVYAALSLNVVTKLKEQNVQLTKELDVSQNEPGRLLADARAQFADREFDKAKQTLAVLFENRPGSSEAAEGKDLYAEAERAIATDNANWEAPVVDIREGWVPWWKPWPDRSVGAMEVAT